MAQKKKVKVLNRHENLYFDLYLDKYEDGLSSMPPLEDDEEEVK